MSQVSSPADCATLRVECACTKETCNGEVVCLETAYTTEIYIRCAPLRGPETDLDFDAQVRRFYGCLPKLLAQGRGDMSHVVHERAFFEDFDSDMESFLEIRQEAYREAGVPEDEMPATTYFQQPPCHERQRIEMQIYAIVPKTDSYSIKTIYDEDTDTTAKLYEIEGKRHLYIANIKGLSKDPENPGDFRQQSDQMFANCATLLEPYGVKFTEVLRTWCYLVDIDRDYAEFNLSRNDFFRAEGVTRMPASTGIEAGLWPRQALVGMDLYALLDLEDVDIDIMTTPTLNEAHEYGSSFARGMRVDLPEKKVLYISGTASINEIGETVHLDDIRKQLERTLLNIKELLAAQGASFKDLVQAASFLKSRDYRELCETILKEWGIRDVPNTLVEAGVCRPELLCEIEAVAILPKDPTTGKAVSCDASVEGA